MDGTEILVIVGFAAFGGVNATLGLLLAIIWQRLSQCEASHDACIEQVESLSTRLMIIEAREMRGG